VLFPHHFLIADGGERRRLLYGPASAGYGRHPKTTPEIIAAQIRDQGYVCAKAISAERDEKLSKADEAAWILKCENATYRVRLVPDLAAKVERLD